MSKKHNLVKLYDRLKSDEFTLTPYLDGIKMSIKDCKTTIYFPRDEDAIYRVNKRGMTDMTVYDGRQYPTLRVNYGNIRYYIHDVKWLLFNLDIDRSLLEDKEIHHIDLDKDNFRLDNLQLMSVSEHRRLHARLRRKERALEYRQDLEDLKLVQ